MKRRDFIHRTAGLASGGIFTSALSSVAAEEVPRPSRVIDTHTHFYDPSRPQGVPWPKPDTKLHRTVLPDDWAKVAEPLGVRETVVVEASEWVEDNQWVLDLAAKDHRILGLVGHLKPNDPDFAKHLRRFAANPIFRGVRWRGGAAEMGEDRDKVLAAARLLAEHDLELDLNGPHTLLPAMKELADEVPELRIVINHLGSAGDPQNLRPEWIEGTRAIAACPNVFMKVSALVEQTRSEEGQAPADPEFYLPILDHLWQTFGEDRLVFGSNWPVSDRGASYEVLFRIVQSYFSGKGTEAQEKYFWKNSQAAYRWVERV